MAEQYEAAQAEQKRIYLDADDLADLADWYATRHKYPQAKEVAEYGLQLHPGNTDLLVEQAYLYIDSREREQAKVIAEEIQEDYPEVRILKANLLLGDGRVQEAEKLLAGIEDKEEMANIIDIAYLYIDMGYPEKAAEWLELGKDLYYDKEAYIATQGDCFHALGLFKRGADCFNRLIDINPYSASYWFGLARCHFDMQQFDKAIDACDYAIVADEEFADAYIVRGHAFYQLGNEEKAMESYRQAEKLGAVAPGFMQMFTGLSNIANAEWAEGLEHLEKAIASKSLEGDDFTAATLYANAALCLYQLGEKEKAHQYCQKARERSVENIDAYLVEGRFYMEEGEHDKGVQEWAQALQYAPEPETWFEIGKASMDIGYLNYAKLAFERVQAMDPDFQNINERLTTLYMILRDKENFLKYNQLCRHPIQMSDLEHILKMLQEEKDEVLLKAMQRIYDALL